MVKLAPAKLLKSEALWALILPVPAQVVVPELSMVLALRVLVALPEIARVADDEMVVMPVPLCVPPDQL